MRRRRYLLETFVWTICILLLYPSNVAWAKARGLGFIIDEHGELRKIQIHTRIDFTLGRGFPFIERPVAVSITKSSSEKEPVRIELDSRVCDWITFEAYALVTDRIVLNGHDDQGRNYFVIVWDWRKNRLRTFNYAGSASPESITGISPDEKWALAVPSNLSHGLIVHDLEHKKTTCMYAGLDVFSPRFSPDGTRWAFFSRDDLIIRPSTGRDKRTPIPGKGKWRYARHLSWSPSGRQIAGIIHHERTDLVIWDSDGKQMKIVGVSGGVTNSWPPIWSTDEKGIYIVIGNEGVGGEWQPLQTKFIPLW